MGRKEYEIVASENYSQGWAPEFEQYCQDS